MAKAQPKYIPKVGEVCEIHLTQVHSIWVKATIAYIDENNAVYFVNGYVDSFHSNTQEILFRKIKTEEEEFHSSFESFVANPGSSQSGALIEWTKALYKAGFRYIGDKDK